ncbi:N-acetylglucosamine-6-phosphate deacetylase [Pseudarthrobacter sp. NBSH8]|uniref:N-acetylglucosamine-6-phosphate deacetylase n=1 Tax=Pseudarthrobacter sp. NBSH8 TaxID=2596911 RepID=UPI00162986AD|nr:amidohydrolase family protein [Pseudarthrobacter sp. NBSH8]QNE14514.1 amidohydrolase family protein [Pseudarthrobacter sp. NBSH8]
MAGGTIQWCGPTSDLPAGLDTEVRQVPLILPGLVDVHCHGAVGHTFSADADGARLTAAHHASEGTTSVLASLVSAPSHVLLEQIAALRDVVADGALAGLHLEGPFITKSMCGAQDPAAIIDGDPALLKQWLETGRGTVRSLTLAPETPHFAELVQLCREHGVVPSLGHTAATASRTREVLGADGGAGGVDRQWSATHLSPRSVALITDAMAAAGMSDGHYTLGSLDVLVQDRVARLAPAGRTQSGEGQETGAIAGATSFLLENERRCVEWGIPLADAVAAASSTPARLMGLDRGPTRVGAIAAGYRADVLVATGELELVQAYRAGTSQTQERKDRADSSV